MQKYKFFVAFVIVAFVLWPAQAAQAQCHADLNGDGIVGVPDLLDLLGSWGLCPDPTACPTDLNGDGSVGVPDLLELLGAWGQCGCTYQPGGMVIEVASGLTISWGAAGIPDLVDTTNNPLPSSGNNPIPADLLLLRDELLAFGADLTLAPAGGDGFEKFQFVVSPPDGPANGFGYHPDPDEAVILDFQQPMITYVETGPTGSLATAYWFQQSADGMTLRTWIVQNGVIDLYEVPDVYQFPYDPYYIHNGDICTVDLDSVLAGDVGCEICKWVAGEVISGAGSWLLGWACAIFGPGAPLCVTVIGLTEQLIDAVGGDIGQEAVCLELGFCP